MRTLLRLLAAALCISLLFGTRALAATPPSFTISPASANEDAARLCFPVRMHGTRSTLPSSVKVTIAGGTAIAGSDYVAASLELLFQPTELGMTKNACFTLVNDTRPEATETVTGKLTKGLNSRLYVGSALGTILDTDTITPPPPAVTWRVCAAEGETCSFAGSARVRYGAGTTWVTTSASTSIACNNAVFGDPLPNVVKHCETDGAVPAPLPPADSWQAFALTEPHRGLYRAAYARAVAPCPALREDWGPPLALEAIYRITGMGVALRSDGTYRTHWSVVLAAAPGSAGSTVDVACLVGLYQGDPPLPWTAP